MPDPSPEQPPSWPPTSEPAATPTNPPRITARGVGHLPSAAPDDEPSAADRFMRPPSGGGVYGESAQQAGPYEELDPETRRSEWGAFDDAPPSVPQQAAPQPEPTTAPDPGFQGQGHQDQGFQELDPQGDWNPQAGAAPPGAAQPGAPLPGAAQNEAAQGDAPDWPPKSSQDWMQQQSQTGWGLTGGGVSWNGPEAPEPAAAPYEAAAPAPGLDQPTYDAPRQPAAAQGGLEFPELRSDPYEADVYGQSQYRGDAGGQDLYQSDPYQAERLQAEAQQAREQYQAQQQPEPFPPVPQQGAPGERPGAAAFGDTAPFAQAPGQQAPERQDAFPPAPQSSYGDQPYPESDYAAQGEPPAAATGTFAPEAVPAQRTGEEATPEPEAPAAPAPSNARVSPPTHRGVRYAIYGVGGLITLGLIIGIVLMLGAEPPREPSEPGGDEGGATENSGADDDALSPEQYSELAAAAGSAEWFSWRYGEAGENGAEELPAVTGDALATEPMLEGAADRSIQGQLGYVTDDGALTGIDHVTAVESTDDALGLTPRAGGRFTEEGRPELELQEGTTADCIAGLGTDLGRPVALARPEQGTEVNAHSVIAFSSGIVATAGISGAQGGTCLQLPAGQVPTDVALTDGNELALVTTWTPESQTGSLVVIALGDKAGSYQSSWSESYPGLPNPGHFGSAAIVGTVELPFSAPTSVDAWSNSGGSIATKRATVADGAGRDQVATAGYAVVGDLSASQVATVDLASTLEGLAAQTYDGTEFAFDATAGDAVGFEGGVADVAATESASAVATADGVVHELDASLQETAATEVGANPTCLVVGAQSGEFIATSRGTATINWVAGGEITKTLADARMTDPLCATETPALGAGGYDGAASVVLVADYDGQKLHSYLDGEATIPGGSAAGGEGFSYGGAYEVTGNSWNASVTVDLE